MKIEKAQRKAAPLQIALIGMSGSGKTLGALLLAKGITNDGKVVVIDTENGTSNLYADDPMLGGFSFDVIRLSPPYTVDKYIQAIELGENEGYDLIIIDSLSHQWAGQGGLLDKKTAVDEKITASGKKSNSYQNWAPITKEHERFKAKLLHAATHLIATMRTKHEYLLERDDTGKYTPKKIGMAPIQREGIEYEFTSVLDIQGDHTYKVSKDRTRQFRNGNEALSEVVGKRLREWLESGAPLEKALTGKELEAAIQLIQNLMSIDDCESFTEYWKELNDETKRVLWARLSEDVKKWIKKVKGENHEN